MIIDDEHELIFVHIPKCAGTSVVSVLNKFDTVSGMFRAGVRHHSELGYLDMNHIPLSVLRQHYPNEYQKIVRYHTFAVLRNPYRRFASSLFMRLRLYDGKPVKQLKQREIYAALDETMDFISKLPNADLLPHEYIHFQKQHTYIYDEGERMITSLYTIDEINTLIDDIGEFVGERLLVNNGNKSPHEQQAVVYRSNLFKYGSSDDLPLISWLAHRLMRSPVKGLMESVMYTSIEKNNRRVFDSPHVRAFIGEYYAEDIRLYEVISGTKL